MRAATAVLTVFACLYIVHGQEDDVVQIAEKQGLTELKKYLDMASLTDVLKGAGPFTVFAPTNEAFDALTQDQKDKLTNDATFRENVLKYHVIGSKVMSTDLSNDQTVDSLYTGNKIRINIYGSGGDQKVLATGAQVSLADQVATNGVVHVVGKVLLPPMYNVVEYAQNNGFSSLVDFVTKAGLADTLKDGNLTVFAPTNDAFSNLPQDVKDRLENDPELLKKVLKYHVVGATWYSAGLMNGQKLTTLQGDDVTVKVANGVMINDANVVVANVDVKNGIIHAMDKVIMPPENPDDSAWGAQPSLLMALLAALLALFYRL